MNIMAITRLNIKRQREQKGLRQKDMADKLNINLRSYQNLESGDVKIDLERLSQIAKILNARIENFIRQEKNDFENNNNFIFFPKGEKEMIKKLLEENEAEKEQLRKQILKKENKYLREKINQLVRIIGDINVKKVIE